MIIFKNSVPDRSPWYNALKWGTRNPKMNLQEVSYQLFSVQEVILKFESLEVWKRFSRLCADLHKHFQNIKDFARFLQYSKGSCGELRTQI